MAGAALVSVRPARAPRGGVALALLMLLTAAGGCLPRSRAPLTVWVVDGQEGLAPDTAPALETEIFSAARGEIRLTAALNETIAFQVGLRTETPPAGPFQLEISDLVGPGGTLPAASTVSLFRVHAVRIEQFRSWYPDHTGRPATVTSLPDILVPWEAPQGGGPLGLGGPGNEIVWVDLRVPPTISPGQYTGRLIVRRAGRTTPGFARPTEPEEAFSCDLRLRVLPVGLPNTRSLPVICRVDPRDLLAAHLQWPREPAEQNRLLPDTPQHQAALKLVNAAMTLFHEHRATPILWASFPKFRPVGIREVEVDWGPYDQLVEGWLTGEAFDDLVGLSHWPIPVSLNYPDAGAEGGLGSPVYARLLTAYLTQCKRHFAERGWLDRTFVRLCPPEDLTADAVERVRQVGGIVRQSQAGVPLVAHLPARSLRGLGWRDAAVIELPDVSIWAPPAMWFEPEVMRRERALGRQTWLMPDHPPYSGTLAVEGLPLDPQALAWQAFRYDVGALWVEHAAEFGPVTPPWPASRSGAPECLIYPGSPYGLQDQPLPSIRLKRLRRGLQDHALLTLLERRGKRLLARSMAEQVVRWACTDACLDHLLIGKPTGWPRDARTLALARKLILHELAQQFVPTAGAQGEQLARLAEWGVLMNQAARVCADVEGVRLSSAGEDLRVHVSCSVINSTNHTVSGRWVLPSLPVGWSQPVKPAVTLPPGTRRSTPLELTLAGLAYNTDGVYPFSLHFDTQALGAFAVSTRLAVAVCPYVERPPTVDGDLSDWPLASSNAAGDFRLVRGGSSPLSPARDDRPVQPTQVFFCMDRDWLYVAVRCRLGEGEQPLWRGDNRVPLDGAVPWGQDVVEILIDPRPTLEGTGSDIYLWQIKPSGVLIARRGCPTDPPVGKSEVWPSGARVAVQTQAEAWVVELALPLAAFGRDALRSPHWGFNVARLDARRGEYSSWSGARGTCYSPKSLGNLILLRP